MLAILIWGLVLCGCPSRLEVTASTSAHCELAPNAKPPAHLVKCYADGEEVFTLAGPPMKLTGCEEPGGE